MVALLSHGLHILGAELLHGDIIIAQALRSTIPGQSTPFVDAVSNAGWCRPLSFPLTWTELSTGVQGRPADQGSHFVSPARHGAHHEYVV